MKPAGKGRQIVENLGSPLLEGAAGSVTGGEEGVNNHVPVTDEESVCAGPEELEKKSAGRKKEEYDSVRGMNQDVCNGSADGAGKDVRTV